ncbi:hypothetical protein SDC9_91908 [bioreactor metagenome]|uniref:VanZ-like domain-containing protein n=1 Tax=bioreactor metagenome TaxID=1076179 RepID=A0A644ZWK3_9ZZZZ
MNQKRILLWLVLLSWMFLIFHLSNQPAVISAETSKQVSQQILEIVQENPTPQAVRSFDSFLRNSAHFGLFLILGLLTYPTFLVQGYSKAMMKSIFFGIFYALTDEIHQIFVEGRAFQLRDLGLDIAGFILGCSLIFFVISRFRRRS